MDQSGDSPPPLLPHQHHTNSTVLKGLSLPRALSSRHRLEHVYIPTGYGPKNGRGGHGSSCLRRIMCFCPGVFCQGFRRGKGHQIELLIALCECHGAEVRVSR